MHATLSGRLSHQPLHPALLTAPLALLWTAMSFSACPPTPDRPEVTRTNPAADDQSVDPATRYIRVEFDQDMAEGSHSWVGGGENYPKIRGRPYWESPRIAVLPVELQPEHDYALNINSPSFANFRARTGEPAEPYPLEFHTGKPRGTLDPNVQALSENKAAVPVLRRTVDRYYAYRDLHKLDWDKLFAEHTPQLESATTPEQFAERAGTLLAEAHDLHVFLQYNAKTYASHSRAIAPNCNLETLRKRVTDWNQPNSTVATGKVGSTGYIQIRAFSTAEALEPAFEALADFAEVPGLIIDVRNNAGGDEPLAAKFAGCFVRRSVVYATNVYRSPDEPNGLSAPLKRTLPPNKARPRYRGRVAVLMGPYCMSSCEDFLLMMKQVEDCKLVGDRSYGSSGNPAGYGLPNGVVVFLSSWQDMTPDGKCFEGQGLAPDVSVKAEPQDFEKADPVLDAALKAIAPD